MSNIIDMGNVKDSQHDVNDLLHHRKTPAAMLRPGHGRRRTPRCAILPLQRVRHASGAPARAPEGRHHAAADRRTPGRARHRRRGAPGAHAPRVSAGPPRAASSRRPRVRGADRLSADPRGPPRVRRQPPGARHRRQRRDGGLRPAADRRGRRRRPSAPRRRVLGGLSRARRSSPVARSRSPVRRCSSR